MPQGQLSGGFLLSGGGGGINVIQGDRELGGHSTHAKDGGQEGATGSQLELPSRGVGGRPSPNHLTDTFPAGY